MVKQVKIKHKRGIPMPTRILASGILLLIQLAILFFAALEYSQGSLIIYFSSAFLSALTVIIIINRRGNPDHKITWIIFILIFPIFGISVFLLWGGGRVLPHIKKRMKICESHYTPYLKKDGDARDRLKYYDLIHSRQADYLTKETGYPLYDRSHIEFYPSGEEFLKDLLNDLENSVRYIYLEYFILAEGVMWEQIHSILKRKARMGVEVKIIFDDFGSIKRQHKNFITKLRSEGISVSVFNPINPIMNIFMNNRNHRKIVVIDGNIAYTGGVNIGDEYINVINRFGHWLDCAVKIEGEAVTSFLVMFCSMWEFTTGKQIDIRSHISNPYCEDDGFVIPYCDSPLNDNNPAEGLYMQILNTAQRYVYIASPYLLIDNSMKTALCMAAKSGIDIRIVTPYKPDKWYVHPASQYNYGELLEAGVRIYEYTPGFIHSKLFVSDDRIATAGSVNMDYRSFVFHFECGAWMCDSNSVDMIKNHFEEVFGVSKEITLKKWKKRPVFTRIKQAVLHIFAPFM